MVPSACVDGSRCNEGLLRILGAWPLSTVTLRLPSPAEAQAVQEQLQGVACALVQSLHLRAPAGAPPLALRPLPAAGKRANGPCERGRFLLGGYAVFSELGDRGGDQPRFNLYWTELCGPSPCGTISVYYYSSHQSEAAYVDFTSIRQRDSMQLTGNVLRIRGEQPMAGARHGFESPPDECLAFRSEGEARLWADLAAAALDMHGRRRAEDPVAQAAPRAKQALAELQGRAQALGAPKAPVLAQEGGRHLQPRPRGSVPVDAVAMHVRRQQAQRLRQRAEGLLAGCDDEIDRPGYESFGTVRYN